MNKYSRIEIVLIDNKGVLSSRVFMKGGFIHMDNDLIYFNVLDVSKILKLTVATIKRYINQGKLKATKLGNSYRISKTDLLDFMNGGKR